MDDIVLDWNRRNKEKIWTRFLPTRRYKFRNIGKREKESPQECRNIVVAASYDWKIAARLRKDQQRQHSATCSDLCHGDVEIAARHPPKRKEESGDWPQKLVDEIDKCRKARKKRKLG